ncbi:Structure-specific endonuclease subunit SLX4, partial [Struthio camelus australis]
PPPLLLQDPETARKRIEERVAMLLAQEVEFPPTPRLPTSRILEDGSGNAAWLMPLPKNKDCFLWNCSALTGPCDPELFYTAGLTPPIVPWKPVQVGCSFSETVLLSVGSDQPEESQQLQPDLSARDPPSVEAGGKTFDESKSGPEGDGQFLSQRQKDIQTLQDLVELAREGLTLTQWNLDVNQVQEAEQSRKKSTSSDTPLSGFVPPSKEKRFLRSSCKSSSLRLLAADFSTMVNNPHLSDVQFQVDSGEIFYAHMFVLYARCPQAVQIVHSEGFLVEEDGNAQTRRVLLSDVTGEAACTFLRYLYAADADVPARMLPQLGALAARFGARELMAKCEISTGESQVSSGVDSEDDLISVRDDKDCENRAENFQELLKSVWVGEDEEEEAVLNPECQKEDDNGVGEQELEEIYEFAATQRKMVQ